MRTDGRDIGGIAMAAVFVALGVLVLVDAGTYKDVDSAVFPRTVALLMIALSVALAARNLLGPPAAGEQAPPGSLARRFGLVAVMVLTSAAMPYVGMLLASFVAFAAIMVIAMYEPWTRARLIVYPLSAAVIVVGFHVVFGELLLVPLPTGTLFD